MGKKAECGKLINRVAKIDLEAAVWLREEAPTYNFERGEFLYSNELYGAFMWRYTPQGHNYWSNIAKQLLG